MRKVAVIVGSIRKDSINKKLAAALPLLGAGRLAFERIRIDDLPLFNQDDESSPTEAVTRFKREVATADGVLFVTPEHNRSVPAALKNAFDWGTRPYGQNAWNGKVAAVIGTSRGGLGSAAAQQHMKNIAAPHFAALLGQPEAYVVFKDGMIDDAGDIGAEDTRKFLQGFIDRFADLVEAMAKG